MHNGCFNEDSHIIGVTYKTLSICVLACWSSMEIYYDVNNINRPRVSFSAILIKRCVLFRRVVTCTNNL